MIWELPEYTENNVFSGRFEKDSKTETLETRLSEFYLFISFSQVSLMHMRTPAAFLKVSCSFDSRCFDTIATGCQNFKSNYSLDDEIELQTNLKVINCIVIEYLKCRDIFYTV